MWNYDYSNTDYFSIDLETKVKSLGLVIQKIQKSYAQISLDGKKNTFPF